MKTVGILHHPTKPETVPVANEVADWLAAQGVSTWTHVNGDGLAEDERMPASDLLIVLGGDGATLRAARIASKHRVPLFCINMGRIGFLSEAELDDWQEKLTKWLTGDFWLEPRLMLRADVQRGDEILHSMMALNDVVVGRGTRARIVRLALFVDEAHVTTYTADGLIIATPTGSTAYSMAAGGPLLPPLLENFLVIPVAPHLSLSRALVLHRKAVIKITIEMNHDATVTADGQAFVHLESGDEVVLQKHPQQTIFARVGDTGYFYQRLLGRLGVDRQDGG
jgi:NAD+ kinase